MHKNFFFIKFGVSLSLILFAFEFQCFGVCTSRFENESKYCILHKTGEAIELILTSSEDCRLLCETDKENVSPGNQNLVNVASQALLQLKTVNLSEKSCPASPAQGDANQAVDYVYSLLPEMNKFEKSSRSLVLLENVEQSRVVERLLNSKLKPIIKSDLLKKVLSHFKPSPSDSPLVQLQIGSVLYRLNSKYVNDLKKMGAEISAWIPGSLNKDNARKMLIFINAISGGGDVSIGMKVASEVQLHYPSVKVVINKMGHEISLNHRMITDQFPDIESLDEVQAIRYGADLVVSVPARTIYDQRERADFDPKMIRKRLAVPETTPFVGVSEYSSVNAPVTKQIDEHTVILRAGPGKRAAGVIMKKVEYDASESPMKDHYFFGYAAMPVTQLKFMKDVLISHRGVPPEGDHFTFVFPGKMNAYLPHLEQQEGWMSFLKDTEAGSFEFQDISGKILKSFDVPGKREGASRVVVRSGPLPSHEFLKYAYFSDDVVLTTGDQSAMEMLGMKKFIIYEELKHKKFLPINLFLGTTGSQFYSSKIESEAYPTANALADVQKTFPKLTGRQTKSEYLFYNSESNIRDYISSQATKTRYKKFLEELHSKTSLGDEIINRVRLK